MSYQFMKMSPEEWRRVVRDARQFGFDPYNTDNDSEVWNNVVTSFPILINPMDVECQN